MDLSPDSIRRRVYNGASPITWYTVVKVFTLVRKRFAVASMGGATV